MTHDAVAIATMTTVLLCVYAVYSPLLALILMTQDSEEEGPSQPFPELEQVPKDDPQRSPDWCHAHKETEKREG